MKDFANSEQLNLRAQKVMVGGVNSPVRSFKRVGGHPLFAKRANGSKLWDADDNEYQDFVLSYGPHLLGHARPEIIQAVAEAAQSSTCLGFSSELEIEWSEAFLKAVPNAEKVRAMSTGTEACCTAIRLARGITGRPLIVKFSGHYHGHVDSLLVDGGSGLATHSSSAVPDSKGLPEELTRLSRVVEFNDLREIEELFTKEGNQIAALILEPVMGNMGVVAPKPEFLELCRALCTKFGALLIFDEVMTGFRVHKNSAQGRYKIKPDLSTFGKVIGGGLPLAALAGPARFMDFLAPMGGVYQAGTLSGNPLSVAAGLAMFKLLQRDDPYSLLESLGETFESALYKAAAASSVTIRVERVATMISVYFRKEVVLNSKDCRQSNEEQFKKFFAGLLQEGILIPPSPFESWFLSTAHKDFIGGPDLDRKLRSAFEKVAQS